MENRKRQNINWNDMGIIVTLIAMIVFFSLFTKSFFTLRNFTNITRQISVTGICAVGMTMVLLTGGIDLSVGSVIGVTSALAAIMMRNGTPIFLAVLAAFAVAILIGIAIACCVNYLLIPPMITTLGLQITLRGAVYLLTGGKSFRTRFDKELIGFGYTSAEVLADVFAFGREQTVRIVLRQGQRKQIWQNGVKKTAAELAGNFAAVLFCPDDLNIIRDGPAARRRMMDMAISQLRPKYGALLAEYSRLYDQKSAILRDWHEKPSLLDTLDDFSDQMCRVSAKLIRYRAAYASRLNIAAAPIHADFSGGRDKLTLAYRTVSTVADALGTEKEIYYALCDHQEQHRRAELDSGQCLTGAHKDDLLIDINGQSARAFASQGQTRTAALSLKLAEREIFHDEFDEYPVLMLDDVLSELDAQRQAFVLNRIGGGQTLITCCEDARIAERTGGRVLTVENGVIR